MSTKNVFINSISAFMPNAPVTNDQIEVVLGQIGEQPSRTKKMILKSNKIQSRHYAIDPKTGRSNYSNAQLAAEAIRLLSNKGHSLEAIDSLICSTTLPDQLIPNHAAMVHGELGSPTTEVISTSGVCVCGVTALKYGWLGIKSGEYQNVVASASENASSSMRPSRFFEENQQRIDELKRRPEVAFEKDFLRWMLSDGAGAMWLSDQPNNHKLSLRLDWIDIKSYAHEMSACMYAGAVKNSDGSLTGWRELPLNSGGSSCMTITQDVKQLNEHILAYTVEKALSEIVTQRGIKPEDYKYFLPHFSSGYFEDRVAQSLESIGFPIAKEKWFTNLYSKGNTGSASIYIILEELFNSDKLKQGDSLLCFIPESGRFSTAFMQLTAV